jgi:transcriptional regulator with XRE-family HTH domain
MCTLTVAFCQLRVSGKADIGGGVAYEEISPSDAFAERMREARISVGLSQAQLSARLMQLGVQLRRQTIIDIEQKARRVYLDEALAISMVLGVAPINLIVPFERDTVLNEEAAEEGIFEPVAKLKVGHGFVLHPMVARAWIRGTAIPAQAPLGQWDTFYCVQVPPATRYRLERLASYVRDHAAKLGRWTLPWTGLVPEEEPPTMAVPGYTSADEDPPDFPAPLWAWIMYGHGAESAAS